MVAQHSDISTDPSPVAVRRRLAADLAPHLVAIRNMTDPSDVVQQAAGRPVRYGVAPEPVRGPVLRAMGAAWRAASTPDDAGAIEVDHLTAISSLVQLHGVDWSLVARTGGPVLLLFDGDPTAVVDASSADLVDVLVEELMRAAERHRERSRPEQAHLRFPERPRWSPTPVGAEWLPEQRSTGRHGRR